MPLYEYQCENCGEVFELIQKFSDVPTAIHEKCGGKVHRLISTSALQFKGSGWYVNDYAKSGSGRPDNGGSKKEGDGAPSSSKDSGSSKDTKDSGSSKDTGASTSSSSDSSSKPAPATSTTTPASSSDKK
jgi:putative FmdB family regulatory protein